MFYVYYSLSMKNYVLRILLESICNMANAYHIFLRQSENMSSVRSPLKLARYLSQFAECDKAEKLDVRKDILANWCSTNYQ